MGRLVHFHSFVGTGSGCCTTSVHDGSCSRMGLTPADEVSCVYRRGVPAPEGRPCRCTHEVADDDLETLKVPAGYELWVVPRGARIQLPKARKAPKTARKKK